MSITGDYYVIYMRNDYSGYAWSNPTPSTNAEEAHRPIIIGVQHLYHPRPLCLIAQLIFETRLCV